VNLRGVFVFVARVGAIALVLAAPLHAQMVSSGAKDQPARPLPPGMKAPIVNLKDIAAQAGLTATVVSGELEQTTVIENTGTGVAIFDYDNDGLPDILLLQGDRLKSDASLTPHLYHNLGNLRFEDVTAKSGIAHTGWGQGVCAGDPDNEGRVSLFLTQWGHNIFLHNLGNGTFRDETAARGLDTSAPRWSTGCAFLDYDRDGFLDLVVAHYVDYASQQSPRPRDSSGCKWRLIPVPCGPRGLKGETVTLYHNDGVPNGRSVAGGVSNDGVPNGRSVADGVSNDGASTGQAHFTDVTRQAGVLTPPDCYGFSVLTGDFDNDGWPDFYVACDSTPSLYFHNKHDGTFEEQGLASGLAVNEDGREQAGMGATAADYDNDGFLDIFKTNFSSDTNTLYRNNGAPDGRSVAGGVSNNGAPDGRSVAGGVSNNGDNTFSDVTRRAGLAVQTRYVKWGAAFVDIDNDGWKDLIVAAGHVYPFVDKYGLGEEYRQPRQFYWNRGDGQFYDMSSTAGPAIAAKHSSRGLAVADLDNDGSEEIVIVNLFEPPSLLKNTGPRGNALLIRALTASGRDAIGARITVTTGARKQIDEVRSGGSFLSQSDLRVHFGLASAVSADVTIRWPQGATETLKAVPANQRITVQEGKGILDRHPLGQ
jgi:hypothetical protein